MICKVVKKGLNLHHDFEQSAVKPFYYQTSMDVL
jgi:hypothetical protein